MLDAASSTNRTAAPSTPPPPPPAPPSNGAVARATQPVLPPANPAQVASTMVRAATDPATGRIDTRALADQVVTAARTVARHAGLISGHGVDLDQFSPAAWDELVAEGSLASRRIDGAEATAIVAELGAKPAPAAASDATFAELFVGLASVARIGRELKPSATAPDGVVEAIESSSADFCIGVQWHPENFWRTGEFRTLFDSFVAAARERVPSLDED